MASVRCAVCTGRGQTTVRLQKPRLGLVAYYLASTYYTPIKSFLFPRHTCIFIHRTILAIYSFNCTIISPSRSRSPDAGVQCTHSHPSSLCLRVFRSFKFSIVYLISVSIFTPTYVSHFDNGSQRIFLLCSSTRVHLSLSHQRGATLGGYEVVFVGALLVKVSHARGSFVSCHPCLTNHLNATNHFPSLLHYARFISTRRFKYAIKSALLVGHHFKPTARLALGVSWTDLPFSSRYRGWEHQY